MENKTVINGMNIRVTTNGDERVIFMNDGNMPHPMKWNMSFRRWDYVNEENMPRELIALENEISEFIQNSDQRHAN